MRTFAEATREFQNDRSQFEARGVVLPGAMSYLPPEFRQNFAMAMDAQPQLVTEPSAGIPAWLSTMIDPEIIRVLFTPLKAAEILGEKKKGDWLSTTAMFPIVEHTGEVSSYGDYAENGSAGANTNFPQRQNYVFQTIKQYGEMELERAGLAKLNWVSEIDMAAATVLNRFMNYSYFFGIASLQNYGLLNDPNLSAALTPATKSGGGTKWVTNGVITATANEIYLDIESLFIKVVQQSGGLVDRETAMILALSPESEAALTATNSFNVNVSDLLKKNFPNLKVISAVQYGIQSSSNPQGVVAGNFAQLVVKTIEGQDAGFAAFSEKLRSHAIVKLLSAFKQKQTAGTWGAILRQTIGTAAMVGI